MEVAEDEGTFFIKCTAEGNNYPPQIYWKLNNGPEIIGKWAISEVVNLA